MKLYTHPASTYSRRIKVAALEKGATLEEVMVDMAGRAHRQPEHLKLHPYGKVPVLVDGDFTLFESTAILEYLDATLPGPSLSPSEPKSRARMSMHMKMCDLYFTTQASRIAFPRRFLARERWDVADQDKARAEIDRHLGVLEAWLAQGDREYLVDDRYTLADLCYVPWFDFLELMEVTPPPAVARWAARLQARPSSRATRMER